MGREAKVEVQLGADRGPCTVLLEPHELILRGAIAARLPIASLTVLRASAAGLEANTPRGALRVGLSARVAASWLEKMRAGPPTLASKLGFTAETRVAFLQPDAELEGLASQVGAMRGMQRDAQLWVVALHAAADLDRLLGQLGKSPLALGQSLWVIRSKGPNAPLKESAVMSALGGLGLVPTKTASVSETRTADRYAPRRR